MTRVLREVDDCPNIGDTYIFGDGTKYIVTGLGKPFFKFIPDEETSCYGLMPGEDYNLKMRYVYLKEQE